MRDIKIVDSWVSRWGVDVETLRSWARIKEALKTATKNTIHYSNYEKCIECDEQKQRNPNFSYCPTCGVHFT